MNEQSMFVPRWNSKGGKERWHVRVHFSKHSYFNEETRGSTPFLQYWNNTLYWMLTGLQRTDSSAGLFWRKLCRTVKKKMWELQSAYPSSQVSARKCVNYQQELFAEFSRLSYCRYHTCNILIESHSHHPLLLVVICRQYRVVCSIAHVYDICC